MHRFFRLWQRNGAARLTTNRLPCRRAACGESIASSPPPPRRQLPAHASSPAYTCVVVRWHRGAARGGGGGGTLVAIIIKSPVSLSLPPSIVSPLPRSVSNVRGCVRRGRYSAQPADHWESRTRPLDNGGGRKEARWLFSPRPPSVAVGGERGGGGGSGGGGDAFVAAISTELKHLWTRNRRSAKESQQTD